MRIHEISLGEDSLESIRQTKMTAMFLSLQHNSRRFQVGDVLHLQGPKPHQWLLVKITHVLLSGPLSNVPKDWAMVSFKPIWTEEWGQYDLPTNTVITPHREDQT